MIKIHSKIKTQLVLKNDGGIIVSTLNYVYDYVEENKGEYEIWLQVLDGGGELIDEHQIR